MTDYIRVPALGFDAQEATLSHWLKAVGDAVQPGEPVAEVESDKVTVEIEAQVAGTITELLVQPGATIRVGDRLAAVGEPDEAPAAHAPAPETATTDEPASPDDARDTSRSLPDAQEPVPAEAATIGAANGVRATPLARRIADEHDIALHRIDGSGPGGRILKADVQSYLTQRAETGTAPDTSAPPADETVTAQPAPSTAAETVPTDGTVDASPLRRAIARRMVQSKTTVPHFYITVAVEMNAALALRADINAALPENEKVTVNDLVIRAAALALRDFPNLNASYTDERIVRHADIHVGVAVAVEGGLLTVVNRHADRATISAIAATNRTLIERARAGKVKPDDVTGATFTVSNLGAYDVEHFAAIINPPQAAILGVATARPTPVVGDDGEIALRTMMQMTLSADHRVSDGMEGVRFLHAIKERLETPLRLVV